MATCGRNSRLNLFDIRLNNNNGPVSDIAFVNYVVGGDQNCIDIMEIILVLVIH